MVWNTHHYLPRTWDVYVVTTITTASTITIKTHTVLTACHCSEYSSWGHPFNLNKLTRWVLLVSSSYRWDEGDTQRPRILPAGPVREAQQGGVCVYVRPVHPAVQQKLTRRHKVTRRRRARQEMRWSDGITDSMHMNLRKLRETAKDRGAWRAAVRGLAKSQTWLSDSTSTTTEETCPWSSVADKQCSWD